MTELDSVFGPPDVGAQVGSTKPKPKRKIGNQSERERRKSWVQLSQKSSGELPLVTMENLNRVSISSESTASEDDRDYADAVQELCYRPGQKKSISGSSSNEACLHHFSRQQQCSVWSEDILKSSVIKMVHPNENGLTMIDAIDAMDTDKIRNLFKSTEEKILSAALLYSAWKGELELVRDLLVNPGIATKVNVVDGYGRNALHYCASSGSVDCAKLLLQYDCPLEQWDKSNVATPIICAAAVGHSEMVQLLLDNGADPNIGFLDTLRPTAVTPLLWAVRAGSESCARLLIEKGAKVNNPRAYSEAPIHVAASQGNAPLLSLLLEHKADVRVLVGPGRMSALHLAAEDNNADCVKLLLNAHADSNITNAKGQTPLHLAALAQAQESTALLLQYGAKPDAQDSDNRTALHCAVVKSSRSTEILRLLLAAGADVNKQDNFGYSALHLAALNECSSVASLLLAAGADLTAKTKGGTTAMAFLVRRTPDVLPQLTQRFDSAISVTDHDAMDADCEVRLDFRVLVPKDNRGESGLFTTLIGTGQGPLLQHPLCRAFLNLKWYKVRKLFLISLLFHAALILSFTVFVIAVYVKNDYYVRSDSNSTTLKPSNNTIDCSDGCSLEPYVLVTWAFLMVLATLFAAKEAFQLIQSPLTYLHNVENYVQLSILAGIILVSISPTPPKVWQHHVAAAVIVLAWAELMMHIGRFPACGLYVQMFTTVAINLFKFLLVYLCLVMGFSFGLAVLFPDTDALASMPGAMITIFVMMVGELDYKDYFYNENDDAADDIMKYGGTAHVIFFVFILLIVVVLMNLLVGLAVSDIQGLQRSAGLDRLVRQAKLIARMEQILFSPWIKLLPVSKQKTLQQAALLVPSAYQYAFNIRPNDPRDDRLPEDIKEGVLKIVLNRNPRKNRAPGLNMAFRTYSVRGEEDDISELFGQINSMGSSIGIQLKSNEEQILNLTKQVASLNELVRQLVILRKPSRSSRSTERSRTGNLSTPDVCYTSSTDEPVILSNANLERLAARRKTSSVTFANVLPIPELQLPNEFSD